MVNIFLWAVVVLLFLVGLTGTVIPGLPGVGLVYAGILLYAVVTKFTAISLTTTILLGIISLLALLVSYVGSAWGSQRGGGKKWSVTGTVVGAAMGAAYGPIGMFAGAFLGALLGAIFDGVRGKQAIKIATYSIIGALGSIVVQFLFALTLIIAFFIAIAW